MNIDALKAKLAGRPPIIRPSDYLTIEENRTITFFVLCEEYTEKGGVWILPVGVHFVSGKQVPCSEVADAGPCYICEQIREMERQRVPEHKIFPIRGPIKYAMNVLVRGEEVPQVFLAPTTVGARIFDEWERIIKNDVNIFDPMASTAFTVMRSKRDGKTEYTVDAAIEPAPIVTGDNVEERIAKILKAGFNLDDRFRLPTREEAEAAWRNR
jgi:hypothetical protein